VTENKKMKNTAHDPSWIVELHQHFRENWTTILHENIESSIFFKFKGMDMLLKNININKF